MIVMEKNARRDRSSVGYIAASAIRNIYTVIFIAGLLAVLVMAPAAQAQVAATDQFTPGSWQPGAETAKVKPARRANVTSTNRLEEFSVPRSRARRIVERNQQQRKVRVAALGNTAVPSLVKAKKRVALKKKPQPVKVASLGAVATPAVQPPSTSITGGGIAWRANSGCLASNLRSVVASLAASYGSVTVNSTCRNARHNRRVGGARKSWHLTGNAVDFRLHGAPVGRVYAYLRSVVGGMKHYGGGRFHIDNGPRRTF